MRCSPWHVANAGGGGVAWGLASDLAKARTNSSDGNGDLVTTLVYLIGKH